MDFEELLYGMDRDLKDVQRVIRERLDHLEGAASRAIGDSG